MNRHDISFSPSFHLLFVRWKIWESRSLWPPVLSAPSIENRSLPWMVTRHNNYFTCIFHSQQLLARPQHHNSHKWLFHLGGQSWFINFAESGRAQITPGESDETWLVDHFQKNFRVFLQLRKIKDDLLKEKANSWNKSVQSYGFFRSCSNAVVMLLVTRFWWSLLSVLRTWSIWPNYPTADICEILPWWSARWLWVRDVVISEGLTEPITIRSPLQCQIDRFRGKGIWKAIEVITLNTPICAIVAVLRDAENAWGGGSNVMKRLRSCIIFM